MADYPNFPTIAGLSYPLREPFYKPKVRTEFENGVVQSRNRFTRGKKRFGLKWEKMPFDDCQTLQAFFDQTGASPFYWVHPLTGKRYTCIFSDDEFDPSLVELDFYDVTVNIEEL